jgi:hypothetical protein
MRSGSTAYSRFSELLDLEQRFLFFKRFVGTALPTIGKKLLLDQCVITPPILAIFYVGNNTLAFFFPFVWRQNCELTRHTDKKENQICLIYKEIQNGAVAKSYLTNGLVIYGEILAHFLIY